ncbi:hypothetical protein J437_LFUL000419 [Ladona fulva]|uniref:Uncharacterized protein n=1 Tax=Ladona fulva TaxID=123851 RepID=A0A8K0K325_LADFU|nr:hypothetical protein J437_LFUL000419 [Ladona fulva]
MCFICPRPGNLLDHVMDLVRIVSLDGFGMKVNVFATPKTIQATVTLLENLHIILEKTPRDEIVSDVLPMLYNAFESSTLQVQILTQSVLISSTKESLTI